MQRTVLITGLSVLVIACSAQAAVLCKKKSGAVFVRDGCKPNETRLDPDGLGMRGSQGAKGDSGQQGAMGSPGATGPMGPALAVKDANGTFVGLTVGSVGDLEGASLLPVLRRVGNTLLVFNVGFGDSMLHLAEGVGYFYYTSADCSGAPLLAVGPDSHWVTGTGAGPDGTLFYPVGVSASYTTNSYNPNPSLHATSQADCPGSVFEPPDQCCNPQINMGSYFQSATIDSSGAALGLVPPFHVEGP